ncbi:MAG: YbaB/EbfC family nucleoid-associated protein [Pseudomonadales bacterium]|nr:YbaB/EbfC family nucleoid-associated protein [Pseudomonadales bacterium]
MLKNGMGDMLKQAKKMQEDMQAAQEKLANAEVIGESGAGLVRVVMTGRHDVKKVEIDSDLMSESKDMLEDLLAAAVNDAVRKVEDKNKEMLSGLTGGLQMPAGFKMPF